MKLKYLFLSLLVSSGLSGLIDGVPDASFGSDGQVIATQFPAESGAQAIAIQSDDKIVIAGNAGAVAGSSNFLIARYQIDGTLDTSFGTQGANTTSIAGTANALVIQPNGQIVAGGTTTPGMNNFVLARYNSDGSLDTSFQTTPATTIAGKIFGLALQSDGKIVAVGTNVANTNALMVRFNTNGSIDTTFAQVSSNFGFMYGAEFTAVEMQHDGKIVVAGTVTTNTFGEIALVARYLPTGQLDTTFATGGFTTISNGGFNSAVEALAIQADGAIVVAGSQGNQLFLTRLTPQGLLDVTFDAHLFPFRIALALSLQSDGKIVVAGRSEDGTAIVSRFTTTGALDTSFNAQGSTLTNDGALFQGVAINSRGKIIAAGFQGNMASNVQINQYVVDSLQYSPLSQAIWHVYYNQVN